MNSQQTSDLKLLIELIEYMIRSQTISMRRDTHEAYMRLAAGIKEAEACRSINDEGKVPDDYTREELISLIEAFACACVNCDFGMTEFMGDKYDPIFNGESHRLEDFMQAEEHDEMVEDK